MSRRVLLCLGGGLTLACLALLIIGYAPEAFRSHEKPLDVIALAPKCEGGIAIHVNLLFREPSFWSRTTGTTLILPEIGRCKSIGLTTTNATAKVRLKSTEAVFKGEKRDLDRLITAQKADGPGKAYEISLDGLNKHWFLYIENAFTAKRSGFDRYTAQGALSLSIGDWTLRTNPDPAYAITGTGDWTMKVESVTRPEDRDLLFLTGATFARMTEFKDIFGILVSTLLGLGLATIVQGLAMGVDRTRRKG